MTRLEPGRERETTRRVFLASTGGVGLAALAGCLGEVEVPDPITLGDQSCDQCGMVIDQYNGPVGQAFYEDDVPEGRGDDPAWFCSSTCTYSFVFDQEDLGHDPLGIYLTDYSDVDWEVVEEERGAGDETVVDTYISAHLDSEDFADATDLTLVADSDLEGSMGTSIIGFSDPEDAGAFPEEYGGIELEHDQIDRDVLSGL
ncbi:nitrous oxide reductase accessory protein NosL [Natrialbaceae archaeon A-gly3]